MHQWAEEIPPDNEWWKTGNIQSALINAVVQNDPTIISNSDHRGNVDWEPIMSTMSGFAPKDENEKKEWLLLLQQRWGQIFVSMNLLHIMY